MDKSKKSFILYSDQKELFDQLSDEQAGKLIKFIFSYVNDEEPTTDDLLINLAFTPIKQQFKRDLDKWNKTKEGRSKAGKASAEARRNKKQQSSTNSTSVNNVQQTSTSSTDNVNVNVNVNDNVNVNVNDIKKEIYSFEEFWNDYDKKTDRKSCEVKWKKIKDSDKLKIKETVKSFVSYKPFKDYTYPNPKTYLNQERWNDDIEVKKNKPKKPVGIL